MKKMISTFGNVTLSNEQMKKVKGGMLQDDGGGIPQTYDPYTNTCSYSIERFEQIGWKWTPDSCDPSPVYGMVTHNYSYSGRCNSYGGQVC